MPELTLQPDPPLTTPLPQNPQNHPQAHQATLPPLGCPPDQKFLGYSPTLAGRAAIIELKSKSGDSRETRQRLWAVYQATGNDLELLGLAAQALERAGLNWRQSNSPEAVIATFKALPTPSVN